MTLPPAELALLISSASAAIAVAVRSLLLFAAGLTALYAKTAARRKAAADLAWLLMTLPWRRDSRKIKQLRRRPGNKRYRT